MRNAILHPLIAALLLSLCGVCFGRDGDDAENDGFELWTTVAIVSECGDNWRFRVAGKWRLDEGASDLYYQAYEAGLIYKSLADWILLGFHFRQIFGSELNSGGNTETRPYADVTLFSKLFGHDVSNRLRFEYRDRKDKSDLCRFRHRLRVNRPFEELAPEIRKRMREEIRPFLSNEIFVNFNSQGFIRDRIKAGYATALTDDLTGEMFYFWQTTRSDGHWSDNHGLGLSLTFHF